MRSRFGSAVALAAIGASLGLAATGCGGPKERTLESEQLPFKFQYPATLKVGQSSDETSGRVAAVIGIDKLNVIAVRRISDTEMSGGRVADLAKESLRRSGAEVTGTRDEIHSGIDMVKLQATNEVAGSPTESKLYIFPFSGGTWEIECQSSGAQGGALGAACVTAIDSVKEK